MKPKVFVGSTKEHLEIANAIQSALANDAYATVWNQGIFDLSDSTLDSLLKAVNEYNYAIFVFTPNDITTMRNSQQNTVRDNVIFELGLFFGKLGKERVYYLIPKDIENFHLPTDLLGITAGTYDNTNPNLIAAVSPFCSQVRNKIKETYLPTFPEKGNYGDNILFNDNKTFINKDKCSFSANIPKDSELRIELKKLDESNNAWYFNPISRDNWIINQFDFEKYSQVFKLVNNDKADLELFFEEQGKALVSIYFNNKLIQEKEINWS